MASKERGRRKPRKGSLLLTPVSVAVMGFDYRGALGSVLGLAVVMPRRPGRAV